MDTCQECQGTGYVRVDLAPMEPLPQWVMQVCLGCWFDDYQWMLDRDTLDGKPRWVGRK